MVNTFIRICIYGDKLSGTDNGGNKVINKENRRGKYIFYEIGVVLKIQSSSMFIGIIVSYCTLHIFHKNQFA